jgi:hypothetical protein
LLFTLVASFASVALAEEPKLPGVGAAMQEMVGKNEIAGAVTTVVAKGKVLHLESTGLADCCLWQADVARHDLLDCVDDQANHRHGRADAAGSRQAERCGSRRRNTSRSSLA